MSNEEDIITLLDEPSAKDAAARKVNRQLFGNSPLSGSTAEQDYANSPDALYNSKDPNLSLQHEKPIHRMMIMMSVKGVSNREIAKTLGCTEPWVSQVLRQPWARQRATQLLRESGVDEIKAMLETSAAESVVTLVELRDDTRVPAAVRKSAASDILDRVFGKPKQPLESVQRLEELSDHQLVTIISTSTGSTNPTQP